MFDCILNYTNSLYFPLTPISHVSPLYVITLASVLPLDKETTLHSWWAQSHMQLAKVRPVVGAQRILSTGTQHEDVALHFVTMATRVPFKLDL